MRIYMQHYAKKAPPHLIRRTRIVLLRTRFTIPDMTASTSLSITSFQKFETDMWSFHFIIYYSESRMNDHITMMRGLCKM
jgi:hypothetical protein